MDNNNRKKPSGKVGGVPRNSSQNNAKKRPAVTAKQVKRAPQAKKPSQSGKRPPAAVSPQKKPQNVKKPVKRPLTPEQKARIEARRKAAEAARKRMLKRLGTVVIIFLTCYLTVSLVTAGLIWANFTKVSSKDFYPVKVYQPKKDPESKKEREKLLATCPAESANIDGELYISYTALSALTDISAVGDRSKITVVFRDGNDVLDCAAFSKTVYINGVPASLTAPVVISGDEYYFPVEILGKYASGVVVTTAEDSDGNIFCKVMLAEYGGELRLNNHSDSGSFAVSEPEQGFDEPSSEADESSQE